MFGWGKKRCAACDAEINWVDVFPHQVHDQLCGSCGVKKDSTIQKRYEESIKAKSKRSAEW